MTFYETLIVYCNKFENLCLDFNKVNKYSTSKSLIFKHDFEY